jgi:hypothetical protein
MHHKLFDDRSEEVRVLATACGFAMGAASMCPSIPEVRLAVAVDRIAEMLRLYDHGTREHCAASFDEAFADGKASVASGEIDDSTAEETLCSLERMLGR